MRQVEDVAEVVAELHRRSEQVAPPYSVRKIVRACFPGVVITGRRLPPHVDEAVARTREGAVIVYRRGLSPAEQRFAIGHALGHLCLDDDSSACTETSLGSRFCEERADRFAEELLLPVCDLRQLVEYEPADDDPAEHEFYLDQVDEIASAFNAPIDVTDKRIRELIRLTLL